MTRYLLDVKVFIDGYLLALALALALAPAKGGQLATFDKRLVADAVRGGARALHLIH